MIKIHNFFAKKRNRMLLLFPPLVIVVVMMALAFIKGSCYPDVTIPTAFYFVYSASAIWLALGVAVMCWSDSKTVR